MRVLVAWGSSRGGTQGIAELIGETLKARGFDVEVLPATRASPLGFDAVIVGGALYANSWHAGARRFVDRHERALRRVPVWLFSSGPLDDSADREVIPPTPRVAVLADRIGAQGHMTFGGRLARDARGFPASSMAKKRAGDFRNPDQIRAWSDEIARALPNARPLPAQPMPGRSLGRVALYGVLGWFLCAAVMFALLRTAGEDAAIVLHPVAAPIIFIAISLLYFEKRGAREPLPVAIAFTAIVFVLDLIIVAGLVSKSMEMFTSIVGTWLPLSLIFLSTGSVGQVMSVLPPEPWTRSGSDRLHPRPR